MDWHYNARFCGDSIAKGKIGVDKAKYLYENCNF